MDLGHEHLVEPMLCHREDLAALEQQRRFARFWVVGATPRSTANCVRERVNLRGTQIVSLALDVEQDDRRTHSPSVCSVRVESWRTLIACRRLSINLGGVRANSATDAGLTAGGDIDNIGARQDDEECAGAMAEAEAASCRKIWPAHVGLPIARWTGHRVPLT